MRELLATEIADAVQELCIKANYYLNTDVQEAIKIGLGIEESETGKAVLGELLENAQVAAEQQMAICQDTGMAVVFVELGQDVHIAGGNFADAVNEGVMRGYDKGFLRKSVVGDPFRRINTGDNTPAIIHYDIVPGEKVKITVAPKGFGSENMSAVAMLKPSDGVDGFRRVVLETVKNAGPNACPPLIIGVGVGGTMEKAAILAKKALLRPVLKHNQDSFIMGLETELMESINKLGIGPAGLGGRVTALAVNIETYPTHIAGLPVAVNISCHATRHAEAEL